MEGGKIIPFPVLKINIELHGKNEIESQPKKIVFVVVVIIGVVVVVVHVVVVVIPVVDTYI